MHICLPDTREVKPQHGSAYLLYNVHIDGLYHCSFRYKQLLHLHQALLKKFTYHQLPIFPPKKLLPLSLNQIEERRIQLEKYLQNISQDKAISNSSIFNLFLLEAQRESTRIRQDQAHLDIELVNGQKIRLQVFTHDSADTVLTAVCNALGLNDRYHAYFCLCLCGYDVIRDKLIIKRRLSFFESPYVTLQMAIQQQEQLHSMLTASNSQCNCCLQSGSTDNQSAQQLTPLAAGTMADNGCQCLSCLNHYGQQASNRMPATTDDVPLVGAPIGANNANDHLGHYNNINQSTNSMYIDRSGNYHNHHLHHHHHHHHHQQQQFHASNQTFYYPHQAHNLINPTTSIAATTSASSFVTHRILLRKSYWDPVYDTHILNDQQALNLLFIQTVYDIKHSLMFVDRETYHKLESLLAADLKLEYILLARTLKYYNYVHFEPCLSDYPRPRTKVMISIGSKELNMRVLKSPKSITKARTSTAKGAEGPVGGCNQLSVPSSSSSASTSTSSSPSAPSSSSSSSSSLPAAGNSTNHNITNQQATNQQVKEPGDQILYCTSSMVPSGYRHLITKDDLVEEEYNFKLPLIRCWRLTSLETLNSNSSSSNGVGGGGGSNNDDKFPTSSVSTARRKTLSLFNSLSISNNSNNNGRQQDLRQHSHSNGHQNGNGNGNGNRNNLAGGTGGSSLLAALVGGTNGFHRLSLPNQSGNSDQAPDRAQVNDRECPPATHDCLGSSVQPFSLYELSFEYLVTKDTLRWITISSDQAIFISISLQGVVDELVSKRDDSSSLYHNPTQIDSATSLQMVQAATISANNQSFTYLYRDGRQKVLNTNNQQLIDKFGTTLGYSPMNQNVLALVRQRKQSLRASNQSSFLSSGSRFAFLGSSQASDSNGNYHSSLEISHLKKAPSPIINDAFEGVTNDEDF